MNEQLLSLFQARIDAAYHEQVWAVAITGAAIGFLVAHLRRLVTVFTPRCVGSSLILLGGVGTAFVWSRYFIFRHYDACIREIVDTGETATHCCTTSGSSVLRELVGLSGTLFYSAVIVVVCYAAVRMVGPQRSSPDPRTTNQPPST